MGVEDSRKGRQTELALKKGREGLNPEVLRWPDGCPRRKLTQAGPLLTAPQIPQRWDRCLAPNWVSGSLRTPLAAWLVLQPVSLPVVAGPYIRCPPALHPAASAMLSRSRCVSRAFSRSLSAFQKVLSGGAGAPMGAKPGCGRTGRPKGRDAACWPGRAPRAPGRRGCRRPRSRPGACTESRSPCPLPGRPRRLFAAVPDPLLRGWEPRPQRH